MKFFPLKDDLIKSDFKNFKLIIPGVPCIGNVGQLAVDLLIETLKCEKIGFLESRYVYPFAANNPFSFSNGLCTTLEVYVSKSENLLIVQQRSYPKPDCWLLFVKEFMDWIAEIGPKDVYIICSGDSSSTSKKLVTVNEDIIRNDEFFWEGLGITKYWYNLAKEQNISLNVVVKYTIEGDNRNDASDILKVLNIERDVWCQPPSWSSLYGKLTALDMF